MQCVNFKGKGFWVRKEWSKFSKRSSREPPRHIFWSSCLHVPAILGNTGGLASFSRPWSGMRDRQHHSSTWHLLLPCSCRCLGTAVLAAFPPRGHAHDQPLHWQKAGDRVFHPKLFRASVVMAQLLALGWTCLHCTVFLRKTVDEELYAILNASFTGFLSVSLLCYEFWLLLSADLQFMPMLWRGLETVKALQSRLL